MIAFRRYYTSEQVCYDVVVQYLRPYRTALIIFGLALLVRFFFLPFSFFDSQPLVLPDNLAFDGYYELAEHLKAGDGFTRLTEGPYAGPDSVRTPLYPLFIILVLSIFGSYKALFVIQAIIGAATAVLAWVLAKEFLPIREPASSNGAGSSRWAAAVGILVALEPMQAYLSGVILTETIFTFIFLIALFLLIRYFQSRRASTLVIASLLLGVAMLIKPTIQYLPAGIIIVLFFMYKFRFSRDFFKDTAIIVLLFVLTISPWMYRNYQTFGTSALVVQPVSNLYNYMVPSVISFETGQTYEEAAADFFAREDFETIEEINLGNMEEYKERAITELKKHPKGFVLSLATTLSAFFTHDSYASILERRGYSISFAHPPFSTLLTRPTEAFAFAGQLLKGPEAFVLIGRIFWTLLSLVALVGVFLYARRGGLTPAFLLLAGTILYFALTTAVISLAVNGRFRVPVDPLIFIFAVYGIHALYAIFHKRPQSNKPVLKTDFLPLVR